MRVTRRRAGPEQTDSSSATGGTPEEFEVTYRGGEIGSSIDAVHNGKRVEFRELLKPRTYRRLTVEVVGD